MLYGEIIAVCSEIHTKHINTLCGQNVELLNVKLGPNGLEQATKAQRGCRCSSTLSLSSALDGVGDQLRPDRFTPVKV
jgi:hypothetical protein